MGGTEVGTGGGQAGDRRGYLQGFETLQKKLHPVVFFVLVLVGVCMDFRLTLSIALVLGHVL